MSGCLGLLTLLFSAVGAVSARAILRGRHKGSERRRLQRMLLDFVTEADQGLANVNEIRAILMTTFAHEKGYEELASAIATFAPGGVRPYHGERWLAAEFRAFLSQHHVAVPEDGRERPGVWPPPPNRRG